MADWRRLTRRARRAAHVWWHCGPHACMAITSLGPDTNGRYRLLSCHRWRWHRNGHHDRWNRTTWTRSDWINGQ